MTIIFDEPVLSAAEEQDLARIIEIGVLADAALAGTIPRPAASDAELRLLRDEGQAAFQRFAAANLRLVMLALGRRPARDGLEVDDLFQEGVLGLLEALRRFDHGHGARFATFALPWIRMRINDVAVTRGGGLGLPVGRAKRWVQVVAVRDALSVSLGRAPSPAEVAERAGRPVRQVDDLLKFRPPVGLGFDLASVDAPEPDDDLDGDDLAVRRLLRSLPSRDRAILVRLFGIAPHARMSYAEVAEEVGLSESTVRRRERSALAHLRQEARGALAA